LFFILILTVKNEKILATAVRLFLLVLLGSLSILGGMAIITGIWESFSGSIGSEQLAIQIGAGTLFLFAGGVPLYIFFIRGPNLKLHHEHCKTQYPDSPWLWDKRYFNSQIVYHSGVHVSFTWMVLSGLTMGFAFVSYVNREVILANLHNDDFETIAFFVVLTIILAPCFYAGVQLLRGQRGFGNSSFEMSTHPGIIGGELAGKIHTSIRDLPEQDFELELRCGYLDLRPRAGQRVKKSHMVVTLWSASKTLSPRQLVMGNRGLAIPVSFAIPAETKESDIWSVDKNILWTLTAASSVAGKPYFSSFEVPVFRTRQHR
jgi:hypothetical protein